MVTLKNKLKNIKMQRNDIQHEDAMRKITFEIIEEQLIDDLMRWNSRYSHFSIYELSNIEREELIKRLEKEEMTVELREETHLKVSW